jgi:hypothetical protein
MMKNQKRKTKNQIKKMKLTKTQTAMMLKLAGKIKTTPYTCNHENAALAALRFKKLAEYSYYEAGGNRFCETQLTLAGKKMAETI